MRPIFLNALKVPAIPLLLHGRCLLLGAHMCAPYEMSCSSLWSRRGSSKRVGFSHANASRRLKGERRVGSSSTFCSSYRGVDPNLCLPRFSRQPRSLPLPPPFSLYLLSFLSRVTAAAISGDSWEDYCDATRRERRSRLLSLLNARVAGESFNYFTPLCPTLVPRRVASSASVFFARRIYFRAREDSRK